MTDMPRIANSGVRNRKNLDELTQPRQKGNGMRHPVKDESSNAIANKNGNDNASLLQENVPFTHNDSCNKQRYRQTFTSLQRMCQKSHIDECVQKQQCFIQKNEVTDVNNVEKSEIKRNLKQNPKIDQEKCRAEKKLPKQTSSSPLGNKIASNILMEKAANNSVTEACKDKISKRLFHHHQNNREDENDHLLQERGKIESTVLSKSINGSSGVDKKYHSDRIQNQAYGDDNIRQRFHEGTGKSSCNQNWHFQHHYSLKDWWLDWPPYIGNNSPQGIDPSYIKLCIRGVDQKGSKIRVEVNRRSDPRHFSTFSKEKVELSSCINHDRAVASGVPEEVIKQFYDGIPHRWRKYLWNACSDGHKIYGADPPGASLVDKSHHKLPYMNVLIEKELYQQNNTYKATENEKDEDIRSLKRSRNESKLTPVMEWWCGEGMQSDTKGKMTFQEESRAQIPSKNQKTNCMSAKRSSSHNSHYADATKDTSQSRWSKQQLSALMHAKMAIPTTLTSFWVEVAKHVQGKSPEECRAKSFEEFASPNVKKSRKANDAGSHPPTKLYRAGSNLFKKQVREFIREYERKNADDVYTETPNKKLVKHAELDEISSPVVMGTTTPSSSEKMDFAEVEDETRLRKIPSIKRAEVDSYVLSLKRQHNHSDETKIEKKERNRKFGGVRMVQECGSHAIEGSISPGGTTNIAINIGNSSSEEYQDGSESEDYD